MNLEEAKAKLQKDLQEQQADINFGHVSLAAELSEDEDDKESIIKWIVKKTSYNEDELENKSYEELKEIHDEYYEWAIRGV